VISRSSEALERVRAIYARAGLEHRLSTIQSDVVPRDRRFDWLLSFNALPLAADWRRCLAELATHAARLAVFVTHPWSYGTWLRRAARLVSRRRSNELFDHASTRSSALEAELASLGHIEARSWVDCPWWPDLFVKPGETLLGSIGIEKPARFVYDESNFPYASSSLPVDLEIALRRHPHFEASRAAPIFAHHRGYLVSSD
jgi:hypothetical protein